jgi:hypothetical protein
MNRTEDAIQIEVMAFLDLLQLPAFHVPNERRCSPAQGAILKRRGVKAGVPDIIICRAHAVMNGSPAHEADCYHQRHGLAIELKSPGNYPTAEQRAWLERLQAEGWTTAVCRSLSQVVDVLSTCGLLRHPETGRPLGVDNARHGFITEARE